MATITGGHHGGNNDYTYQFLRAIANGSASIVTATELKITNIPTITDYPGFSKNIGYLDIQGTGFSFDVGAGLARSGTVTSISDGMGMSITGLNVSLVSLWNAVATGDSTAIKRLLFAGGDTFTATSDATGSNVGFGNNFYDYGGNNTFNMQALTGAGDFILTCGGGNNVFNFAGGFGSSSVDYISCGGGNSTLNLNGDYWTAGYSYFVTTCGVSTVNLSGGHSYNLKLSFLDRGTNNATAVTVNASALGVSDSLTIYMDSIIKVPVTIDVGAGSDTITGNASTWDNIVYSGNFSAYTVQRNANGSITVAKPGGATDTLKYIEQLVFGDKTVAVGPVLVSLTSSATSGSVLAAGDVVTFTATFGEAMMVNTMSGPLKLTLNNGATASYSGGSGTDTVTFSYTVRPGEDVADLKVTGLGLNEGGVIKDAAGVPAFLQGWMLDTGARISSGVPMVTKVSAYPASGRTIGVGQSVSFQVTMSGNVYVTGKPTLTLSNGQVATYSWGSGTSTLQFSLVTASGHDTSDLTVTGLTLPPGASINDAGGHAAVLTGAVYDTGLGIDTVVPSVLSVTASAANGSIVGTGQPLFFTLNMSKPVSVDGNAYLKLSNGAAAFFYSGSGTTSPTFRYASVPGEATVDLKVTGMSFGYDSSIHDAAGNAADLTGVPFDSGVIVYNAPRDFNIDGVSDILWQNTDGQAAIWTMDGLAQIDGSPVGGNPGANWKVVGAATFDGTWARSQTGWSSYLAGYSDIIWQNTDNGQVVLRGMYGLEEKMVTWVGCAPGADWHVVGTGDFSGHDQPDLLWQNTNGQAVVWTMSGIRQTGSYFIGGNPGPQWHIVGTGDFLKDESSDIVWQNITNGQVIIWTMSGTTQTGSAYVGGAPGTDWKLVGVGDFFGNGQPDLLWQDTRNGQAVIWTMDGVEQTDSTYVGGAPGASWHIVGTGDYNRDGKADILWQNDNGQAAVWMMNGTKELSSSPIGGNPGSAWHIATGVG